MASVGNLSASLSVDTSQLVAGLDVAGQQIKGFGKNIGSAGNSFKAITSGFADMDVSSLAGGLGSVSTMMAALGPVGMVVGTSLAVAGAAFAGIVKPGIAAAAATEQAEVAFTTMLGSADKAAQMMGSIKKFAAETPFETPELVSASKQLLAMGIEAENIIPSVRMLGDAATSVGAPLESLAYIFGQVKTTGRAMTADINQFANRGIPLWQEIANMYGVSVGEVRNWAENHQISFDVVNTAFQRMTSAGGKFAGGMKAQSETFNGLLSTMRDSFGMFSESVGSAVMKGLDLKGWIASLAWFGDALRGMFTLAWDSARAFFGPMNSAIGTVRAAGAQLWGSFGTALGSIGSALGITTQGASGTWTAFLGLLGTIRAMQFQTVANALSAWYTVLGGLIEVGGQLAGSVLVRLGQSLGLTGTNFTELLTSATAFLNGLIPTKDQILGWMEGIALKGAVLVDVFRIMGQGAWVMANPFIEAAKMTYTAVSFMVEQTMSAVATMLKGFEFLSSHPAMKRLALATPFGLAAAGVGELIAQIDKLGAGSRKDVEAFFASLRGKGGTAAPGPAGVELPKVLPSMMKDWQLSALTGMTGSLEFFGFNSWADEFQTKLMGLDDAHAAGSLSAERHAEAVKKLKEAYGQKLDSSAVQLWTSTLAPLEKFKQEMANIGLLMETGRLTEDTAMRAQAAQIEALAKGAGVSAFKSPEAITAGSREALSMITRMELGAESPQARAERIMMQALEQQKQQSAYQKQLVEAWKGLQVAEI